MAEFASRRPSVRGPGGSQAEFAADELADELHLTPHSAAEQIDYAATVARRLPATFAALAAGRIHPVHARIIADETRFLTDEQAAKADQILAEAAAQTFGQTRHAAHKLVLTLDPEAAKKRKEAARGEAHVRRFPEESGNAGMVARELPSDEVLASWQHVEQRALDLRAAGMPGTLQELRVRAYLDLLQERDSRDLPASPVPAAGPIRAASQDQPPPDGESPGPPSAAARPKRPPPDDINSPWVSPLVPAPPRSSTPWSVRWSVPHLERPLSRLLGSQHGRRTAAGLRCGYRWEARVRPEPGAQAAAGLRTSQADRERVIELLKAAFVQGRLDRDEFEVRVGQALVSRTHAELAVVTADLPAELIGALPRRPPVRARRRIPFNTAVTAGACMAGLVNVGMMAALLSGNAVGVVLFIVFTVIGTILAIGAIVVAPHAPERPTPGAP